MQVVGRLRPEYKIYESQKCFVGHSREAAWRDDILSACAEALPKFGLEPWYAADHFDPTKPLRDKVVELIANARYGIYDLSSWQDKNGEWHLPRNVLIELGMAIALNRPALLLRHTSNKALPLPACLQGVELLEFAGETTLKKALKDRLPQWLDVSPDRDWLNRFCIFGNRVCSFREEHPRARQWEHKTLRCHISDGLDKDHPGFQKAEREEIRGAFENIFSRYSDLAFDYLDELSPVDSYQLLLCSHCQTVRSTPFAVYRILPHAPAEVFIAVGMSIAIEALFEGDIPKVLLVRQEQDLPSLLRGYEVVEAVNSSEVKQKLKAFVPAVMQKVRETAWKPRVLPFTEVVILTPDEIELPVQTGEAFIWATGLREVLQQIVNSARLVLGGASAVIWTYDAVRKTFPPEELTADGVEQELMERFRGDRPYRGSTAEVVIQQGYLAVTDIEAPQYAFLDSAARGLLAVIGAKAFQGIALREGDETLGVLYVNYDRARSFSEEDREMARTLANQTAVVLKKARLLEAMVTVLGGLQSTLNSIVEGTREILGCDAVSLYTYDQVTDKLGYPPSMIGVWYPEKATRLPEVPMDSIVFAMLQLGKAYIVGNTSIDPLFRNRRFVLDEQVKSCAAIPLKVGERKVGVMFVNYRNRHRFTDDEATNIGLLADRVAGAILNAQQHDRLGGQAHFLLIDGAGAPWSKTLEKALISLGTLQVVAEGEVSLLGGQSYDVTIIDATTVKNVDRLVARVRDQQPNTRIAVVTSSPTWRQARQVLAAGAIDYILKATNTEKLLSIFEDILAKPASPGLEKVKERSTQPQAVILFADNDQDFLTEQKRFLEAEGYEVVSATTPIEAKMILQRERIDLAILDLDLEDDDDERDISGLTLAQDDAFRTVPKIIMAAYPSHQAVREALAPSLDESPPAADFIAKQEGPEAVLRAIDKILSGRLIESIQTDDLRDSLLPRLVDFESALRELVDRALQSSYGQEWPEQLEVAREPNRLSLGVLLRLVREQREVFEPLFTTPQAYGTLVTTAREITTTRNTLAHGVPGPDAAEMQRVQKLVEELLPVVHSAAKTAGSQIKSGGRTQDNRLATLLRDFATNYEFPHRIDPDARRAEIGIPIGDKLITAGYSFDPTGNSYEYVVALMEVNESEKADISLKVMTMSPLRGITLRTVEDKLVVLGSRDGLTNQSDAEIERGYMDDIARVSEVFRQLKNILGKSDLQPQILVATFGLVTEEVLASGELPPDVPTDYPHLCDWLEEDLQRRLHDRIGDFQYPEASKRDGEILSVRIAFQLQQQNGQPDFGDLGWWSLLELASFEEVYPEQDAADFWGG